jgi:hypothetical protein
MKITEIWSVKGQLKGEKRNKRNEEKAKEKTNRRKIKGLKGDQNTGERRKK